MIALPTVIMRQTDSSPVNNSNVLVNDDTLTFPVSGNSRDVLLAEAFLLISAPDITSDFKFGWSVPAGVTGFHGPMSAASNLGGFIAITTGTTPASLSSSFAASYNVGTFAGNSGLMYAGLFFIGGTAGAVALKWAQNTPFVGDTTLLKGSFIRLSKLQ